MLSIIIITKNEEKCLPRLLESIKRQNFRDYEIIVSDAQSTDRTREIALAYGCKIVEGGLPSVGRNNGARVAKGEILLFLDSDVVLPNDFLRKSLKEMKKRDLGCAAPIFSLMSSRLFDKFIFSFYNNWIKLAEDIYPQAGGSCIFLKKEIFYSVEGFDISILFAEDADFIRRVSKITKFGILREIKCFLDPRIMYKESRIKLIYKNMLGAGYRTFFGEIRKPFFNYTLNGGVNIKDVSSINRI
ncbi:MAG TPA: glycosyltransferase [Candidatus Nanoarchaeia archaeon]|nr:glycosyltransferase [Candidatus Nanoarchaeia archaeon]